MKRLVALYSALFLGLAGPGVSQTIDCTDGTIFDEQVGDCVPDPNAGSGGGGGTGDDGTTPKQLRFLTPDDGDSFAAGTVVAPTGRSSLALVQELPLDLTVILDRSGSMNAPTAVLNDETPNPTDRFTRWDLVERAMSGLLGILPADAQVTIVDFARDVRTITTKTFVSAGVLSGRTVNASLPEIDTYIDAIVPENETRMDLALRATLDLYNSSIGAFPGDAYDREILVLSDGQPTVAPQGILLNALRSFGDISAVSLPGNSNAGNAFLADLAQRSGGQFVDYSTDAQGFLNSFLSIDSLLSGLTGVEITDPDGNSYNVATDALGQFTLDAFTLKPGENIFKATATFADQSTGTANLTLVGTGGGGGPTPPPVPLPAAVWMLLAALSGLGALRLRKA